MQYAWQSAVGSALAEFLMLPVCTVKTQHQNHNMVNQSIPTTVRNIYRQAGIRGFYSASVWAITSQVVSSSSKWTFYRLLEDHNKHTNKFTNGCLSGVASSLLTHPLDALKIHKQMQQLKAFQWWRLSELYRGYSKTLTKAAVGSTLFFPLYEYTQTYITNDKTASAMISATFSTCLLHPIDYLKTRHVFNNTLYQDGWQLRKYYRGLSLNLLRVVPHFTIWMATVQFLSSSS